jgi:flagellar hook-length control protein FliK
MPTTTAAALLALNALNLRNTPGVPIPNENKDAFQALLDVSADAAPDEKKQPVKEERKEILAAPVDAPAPLEKPPVKINADAENHDAHVRAFRSDKSDTPRADDVDDVDDTKDDDKTPVAAKPIDNSAEDTRAADTKTANTAKDLDDAAAKDELAAQLRDRLKSLSDLLDMLAALGGNPQDGQVKIEAAVLQSATVTQTTRLTDIKLDNQPGGYAPDAALKDISAQIAGMQDFLNSMTTDNAPRAPQALRGLIHDMREFLQYLNQNADVAKEMADDKATLIQGTRALINQYKQMMQEAHAQQPVEAVTVDTDVKKPTPTPNNTLKQPLETLVTNFDTKITQPASMPLTVSFTAVATAAAANSNVDTQTGGGNNNQNNNGQPLLQSIGGVKDTNQTNGTQSTSAPDFAKLLQQAKTPVLDQVMLSIKASMAGGKTDGGSEIKIQLHPAELGKLEIKMDVGADGKTGVRVTADNVQTLDMLRKDSSGLERALADAGLKTDSGSLSFNLRGEQQQNQQSNFAQSYKTPISEDAENPVAVLTRSYMVNVKEGLDLTV